MLKRFYGALALVAVTISAPHWNTRTPGWTWGEPCVASTTIDTIVSWSGALSGKSTGHSTIECDHPSRGTNVRLHAGGLAPNGLYAVLFVDYDGKEKPLGVGKGEVKADPHGWLDYSSRIAQCPLPDKIKVIVRFKAPSGPPQDVLTGVLSQE